MVVVPHNLIRANSLVVSTGGNSLRRVRTATGESLAEALSSEPRSLTALLLEGIALRHQIAVLQRSGTRGPCFRP